MTEKNDIEEKQEWKHHILQKTLTIHCYHSCLVLLFPQIPISLSIGAEVSTCPDWDLCVDCFGAGVELGKHKNDHVGIGGRPGARERV